MNVIRRATIDDVDAIVEMAAEFHALEGDPFDAPTARSGIAGLVDDDDHGVILVVEGGDGGQDGSGAGTGTPPGGYAAVTWGWSIEVGGQEAVLDELYVRHRGQGTGSRLLIEVERVCRRHGMRRIFLETERPNAAARRLYERHGFVADDSIWMAKPLTASP